MVPIPVTGQRTGQISTAWLGRQAIAALSPLIWPG
jgi:hypothetical protein